MTRLPEALLLAAALFLLLPSPALAYLDPGTGSMLLSALMGLAATLFFMLKNSWHSLAGLFYRLRGREAPRGASLAFWSEGAQYWTSFQPVLEELERRGEKALYLAADADDPGLARPWKYIEARRLGRDSRGFALLNMLEAELCVLTTPGLDVLQIHRSPGVRHYVHLMHAVTDAAYYKLYAFDWFDSVMCAGPHQLRSLRALEETRGLRPKLLLQTGCLYMDALARGLEEAPPLPPAEPGARGPRLLLAPTWGNNGLFSRFGLELLLPLLKAGYNLTLRPHPQSFISEQALLASLRSALAPWPAVHWDNAPSPLEAMRRADVLISDLSGIVFDFAFLLEKPVITLRFTPDKRGKEAADLPWEAWELEVLPELGAQARPEDISALPEIIAALPEHAAFAARMRALRERSLFNFRRSGQVAAEQLLELRDSLRSPDNN